MSTAQAAPLRFPPAEGPAAAWQAVCPQGTFPARRGDATAAAPRGGASAGGGRCFGGVRISGKPAPERRPGGPVAETSIVLRAAGPRRGACARLAAHPAWLRAGARAASAAPASRPRLRRLPSLPPLRVLAPLCIDDSVVARPVLTCARPLARSARQVPGVGDELSVAARPASPLRWSEVDGCGG